MGRIKDIAIKIENREALTLNEFNVAKESGLNGIKFYNSDKKEIEVYIVDWKDDETVVDGELINTYGGDFIYRDVVAKMTDDNIFTLYETQYGCGSGEGEIEFDNTDPEIREIVLGL